VNWYAYKNKWGKNAQESVARGRFLGRGKRGVLWNTERKRVAIKERETGEQSGRFGDRKKRTLIGGEIPSGGGGDP